MKTADLKVGLQVVLRSEEDAQLYRIKYIDGRIVGLEYARADGVIVSGGETDVSLLQAPNTAQLAYSNKESAALQAQ